MSPRLHPDVDTPGEPAKDPAVRAARDLIERREFAIQSIGEDARRQQEALRSGWIDAVLEVARPIWAEQLAIAIEDAAPGDPHIHKRAEEWYQVAEFIRAREERS